MYILALPGSFSSPFKCFRAIYRAKKRNTKKKVLTLAQKSP